MDTGKQLGRPRISTEPIASYNIGLRASDIETAKALGDGNISAGIRKALDKAKKRIKKSS